MLALVGKERLYFSAAGTRKISSGERSEKQSDDGSSSFSLLRALLMGLRVLVLRIYL